MLLIVMTAATLILLQVLFAVISTWCSPVELTVRMVVVSVLTTAAKDMSTETW